jgi:hypothetical protein
MGRHALWLSNKLTKSLEQNPSLETGSRSATKEIPPSLRNSEFYFCYRITQLTLVLYEMNPVHIFSSKTIGLWSSVRLSHPAFPKQPCAEKISNDKRYSYWRDNSRKNGNFAAASMGWSQSQPISALLPPYGKNSDRDDNRIVKLIGL